MNVILVIVITIAVHVKVDIFYFQENASNATIIANQLVTVVNVQVVMMVIICIDINA